MRLVADPADFLDNPRRLLFDPSLISSTLSHLTPNNTVLLLGTQSLNVSGLPSSGPAPQQLGPAPLPWPELTQVEPYYGTQFVVVRASATLLESWGADVVGEGVLALPGKNEFTPEDLALVSPEGEGASVPVEIDIGEQNGDSY